MRSAVKRESTIGGLGVLRLHGDGWWLFSRSVVSNSLWPHGPQHIRLPCPSLSPRVGTNSCPLNWWCPSNHLIVCCPLLLLPSISHSISYSFSMSQLFTSSGQSNGASASASVLPINIQGWFQVESVVFNRVVWGHFIQKARFEQRLKKSELALLATRGRGFM